MGNSMNGGKTKNKDGYTMRRKNKFGLLKYILGGLVGGYIKFKQCREYLSHALVLLATYLIFFSFPIKSTDNVCDPHGVCEVS